MQYEGRKFFRRRRGSKVTGRENQIPGDLTIHDRLAEEIQKAEREVDSARKQLKHDTDKAAKEVAA